MAKIKEQDVLKQLRDPKTKRRAFEEVVRQYGSTIYWQIRHMVTGHDDADDVLQNTFLKAWNNIDSFKGDSLLSTWIYRIAYNESVTFLQRTRELQNIDSFYTDDDTSGDKASVTFQIESDEFIDGDEVNMLLHKALLLLPPKQKAVFTMKYFDDLKYEEISEITGTSIGALKASYHLAVEKITKFIKVYDG